MCPKPKALARKVSDPDLSHDEHVVGVCQESQRDQVRPPLLVEADRRRVVPGLPLHRPVGPGTAGGGLAVAAGDLVGRQHLQEVVMGQPVRSGQGQPLGEGVEQLTET